VKRDHHGGNGRLDVGTWQKANRRVKTRDIKEREDISKYLSAMNAPKY
jgi:hypothetical protein